MAVKGQFYTSFAYYCLWQKMCKGNYENLMKIEGIILWFNYILGFESSQETSHSFPNLYTRRTEFH